MYFATMMLVILELFRLLSRHNSVQCNYIYFFAITMAGYSILGFYPVKVIMHSF